MAQLKNTKKTNSVTLNAVKDPCALDPAGTLSNFLTTHPTQKVCKRSDNISTQGILRDAQNDKSCPLSF